MSSPFFSIIIPVYNVALYLKNCLKSLQDQTYNDFESILIDDGSTDGSETICDSISSEDYRIKVIHKANKGVASARNSGIKIASGKYILFLDSDDTFEKETLFKLHEKIIKTNSDIIVFGYKRINENGEIIKESAPDIFYTKEKMHKKSSDLTFLLWNKAYKRNLFDQIDLQAANGITFSEDSYITAALQSKANTFSFINESLYNYLCRSTSVTQKMTLKNHTDRIKAIQLIDNLYETGKPQILKSLKFDTKFFYIDPRIYYDKNSFLNNCKNWRKLFPESNSQRTAEIGSKKMFIYILMIRLHLDKIAYCFYSTKQKVEK